jgi:hypothetical protein
MEVELDIRKWLLAPLSTWTTSDQGKSRSGRDGYVRGELSRLQRGILGYVS